MLVVFLIVIIRMTENDDNLIIGLSRRAGAVSIIVLPLCLINVQVLVNHNSSNTNSSLAFCR